MLINNNSSDRSTDIAIQWINKDSRFKLFHENKQGVAYASNTGAKKASGKYIARMDADDWCFRNRIKLQANFLDNNPEFDVIAGQVEYVSHRKDTDGFKRYVDWNNSILSYEELLKNRFIEMPLINPTCMWRKSTSDKHELYLDGDFPEDYEMWLRWLNKGVKIKKLERVILKWNDSDTRLTRTHPAYSDSAFYHIKTKYLADWLKNNNPFFPEVVIWGASKTSRKRANILEDYGCNIKAYVDIKKSRQLDKKVIHYEDIDEPGNYFILVYMKLIDARNQIIDYLRARKYVEGIDFLLVS